MEEGGWDWKTSRNFLQKCPKTFVRDCRLPESSGKVEDLKQSQNVGKSIVIALAFLKQSGFQKFISEIARVRNEVIILHIMVNIVLTLQFIVKIYGTYSTSLSNKGKTHQK